MTDTRLVIGSFLTATAVTLVLNWLALIPYRRALKAHWTERARRLYPARIGAALMLWLLPADLVLAQRLLWPEAAPSWPLAAFASWLGAIAGTYFMDHEILPWLTLRAWLHQVLASWTLRFGWCVLFFGTLAAMPGELNWQCWALAGFFLVAFAGWAMGGAVWLCRQLRLAVPAPDRLRALVAEVSARMGVPVRGIWALRVASCNAFAMPYSGDLLFSVRLLSLHPDDEIAAICAHELGHLGESRVHRAMRLVGVFAFVPWLFTRPLVRAWGMPGILLPAVCSWLAFAAARRIGRRLETRADHIAHTYECDPGTYARALARLYEANLAPAVMPGKRHVHPDLYDRLIAAGVQPDYPRPAKPSRLGWQGFLMAILFGLLVEGMLARLSAP